jgi:hypothetical protein
MALACPAAVLAQPCNQGLPTGNLTGVVNTYYPGAVGTAAAGSTTITVDTTAIRGASTTPDIVAGDMLLVIQMQDAEYNQVNTVDFGDGANGSAGAGSTALNNSGRYEYVEAEGIAAGVITIRGANIITGTPTVYGLLNSYTTAARDDAGGTRRGQRTFQVVRVARRASATLTAGLTASAWNGRTGGILAVDVAGDLALGGVTVNVNGLGFRGGVGVSQGGDPDLSDVDYMSLDSDAGNARKAEGIACTPDPLTQVPGGSGNDGCPRGDRARGAPGNAGGGGTDGNPNGANDQNTGGGGGGNGGTGGVGGNAWNSAEQVGGRGGASFPAAANLLIMGGGGGAGTSNNLGPANGAAGGGMVFIRTGTVSGTGALSANGGDAACSAQDGAGGAGAGGSVLFFNASGALTNLTVTANGGRGGDADFTGSCAVSNSPHGPGGGGGGGVVFASSALNAASAVVGGQSGRTTGNIAYGSTVGTNGSISTTLAVTSIPGVQACTVATNATLAGLRVRRGLVEFATASQRDTLGFQLYSTADPAGHRGNRALHARPITAPLPDVLDAVLYRVPVTAAVGPYVLVEEIETSGRRRALGPFPVGDTALREAFERLERRAAGEATRVVRGATVLTGRPLQRRSRPVTPVAARLALGAGAWGVKVETRGRGTATVTLAELAAAGLPPGPPETIRVFHLGQLVPHQLLRARGGLPSAIAFVAGPLSTDYTDRSPYVVTRAAAAPPAPRVSWTRSGPPLPDGWERIETNAMYAPFLDLASDPWVWDFMLTGLPTLTKTFDLPALAPGADPVPVRVHFAGSSAHVHQVRATLNGVPLGALQWSGRSHGVAQGFVPRAQLQASGNVLAIDYEIVQPTDPPTETGVAFLDAIDIGAMAAPAAGQTAQVARLAPFDPRLPDLSAVDYVVLTHRDFQPAAARLASWHAGAGRVTAVVDVERAYDAFASGAFEAEALRALLRALRPGAMVVLFGDDTLDPRDYLGLGSVSYVPSLMAWDGQFGRIASENRYADQDGDGGPDLAIGRLPSATLDDADALVDKIELGGPVIGPGSTHVVAVDDHGPSDVPFRDVAARLAGSLPLGSIVWADVAGGIGPARAALLDAWSQGPVAVQYFGHSGVENWADEHLLTPADAAGLANIGPPPVVFSWTCQAQWYQYHLGPSVNEALLLAPQGGALATFGPTGISDPGRQALLAEHVLKGVVNGVPLGESIRQAKAQVLLQHAGMQGVVEGFTLLGDPALVVGGLPSTAGGHEQDR